MRKFFSVCLCAGTGLLILGACAGAPTRPAGITEHRDDESSLPLNERTESSLSDGQTAPPPPPTARKKLPQPIVHQSIGAPKICATDRPDSHRAFLMLAPARVAARPEELFFIQQYLREAWRREMPNLEARFFPQECDDALLCVSVPAQDFDTAAGALGRALSSRPQIAFYGVRPDVLSSAEEWDRSSPNWKLSAASSLLFSTAPEVKNALSRTPLTTASQWQSLFRRASGSGFLKQAPLYALDQKIDLMLITARIAMTGPRGAKKAVSTFIKNYTPRSQKIVDTVQEWHSRPRHNAPKSPAPPIILGSGAGHRSYAHMTWNLLPSTSSEQAEVALQVMVDRWQDAHESEVRVQVQPMSGTNTLPAILLDGPYEAVLATLSELATEHDRFISASGAATREEWDRAALHSPRSKSLDSRCVSSAPPSLSGAQKAFQIAGPPAAVVWGAEAPETTSEQALD